MPAHTSFSPVRKEGLAGPGQVGREKAPPGLAGPEQAVNMIPPGNLLSVQLILKVIKFTLT